MMPGCRAMRHTHQTVCELLAACRTLVSLRAVSVNNPVIGLLLCTRCMACTVATAHSFQVAALRSNCVAEDKQRAPCRLAGIEWSTFELVSVPVASELWTVFEYIRSYSADSRPASRTGRSGEACALASVLSAAVARCSGGLQPLFGHAGSSQQPPPLLAPSAITTRCHQVQRHDNAITAS